MAFVFLAAVAAAAAVCGVEEEHAVGEVLMLLSRNPAALPFVVVAVVPAAVVAVVVKDVALLA